MPTPRTGANADPMLAEVKSSALVPAAPVPHAGALLAPVQARISRRFLLSLYWTVPCAIAIGAVDVLFLHGWVQKHVPFIPEQLVGYTLIFNAPHLVASELTLFDRDYMHYYKKHILLGVPICVGLVFLVTRLATLAQASMINVAVVNYHLMAQQIGLSRPMAEYRGRWLELWKWLAVTIYIAAFAPAFCYAPQAQPFIPVVWTAALLLLIPATVIAAVVYRGAKTDTGKLYVIGNQLMLAAMIPAAKYGYSFFLILVPRIVHDLTAYTFYVTHDLNRNRDTPRNLIYRWLHFSRIPVFVLFPVLSIALAYALSHAFGNLGFVFFIGPIALFHYYMEGVMWKGAAPHRRSIAFA